MTYLQIVNKILRRLREREVSSVNENDYSALIGIFVNDAKQVVEEAWSWSGLRNTLTATTIDGTFGYELNGSQNNFTMIDAINISDGTFLHYKSATDYNQLFNDASPEKGSPYYYSFNGISPDGDTQIDLYPIPDAVYTLRFNMVQRTPDLANESDIFLIPTRPIELLAYALAVEERGEDGGFNPATAYALGQTALTDSISLDAGKHPEETVWSVS